MLNANWHIERERLLGFVLPDTSFVLIQGKPGQGKTVLAAELLSAADTHSIWLSLDSEGSNIRRFLSTVLQRFEPTNPVSDIDNLEHLVDRLVDVLTHFDEPVTFVIDNFDVLHSDAFVRAILVGLIQQAPVCVRFVVCSRLYHTEFDRRLAGHDGTLLDDELLAFDIEEAIRLNQTAQPLNNDNAIAAWQHCNGWPILVNAGRQQLLKNKVRDPVGFDLESNLHWGFDLLLQSLPTEDLHALVRLSFFSEFDRQIVQQENASDALSRCGALFVQQDAHHWHLDQRFRQYLNGYREHSLDQAQITSLVEASIQRAMADNRFSEVIEALAQLDDVARIDEFLKTHGNLIRPEDWPAALFHCRDIEPEAMESHPWLALHNGRWMIENTPNVADVRLEDALRQFVNQQDVLGELLALTYFFEYKLNIGRATDLIARYPRFKELADTVGKDLHGIDQIAMQIQLAGVEIYCTGNTAAANKALDAAQLLLVDFDLPDDETMVHAFRSIDHLLNERTDAARTTIEELSHLGEPVREDTRITVAFMYANYLPVIGETESLKYFVNDAMEYLRPSVLEQRQTGGFLRLVQAQFLLFAGRYEEALTLLTQAANTHVFITAGDVREQGHIVTALTYAALGDEKSAREQLAHFEQYSVTPAYRFRQMLNRAMIHVYLKEWSQANLVLDEIIGADDEDGVYAGSACGIKAYSLHLQGLEEAAAGYVKHWAHAVAQRGSSTLLTVGNTQDGFAYLIKAAMAIASDSTSFLARIGQLRASYPDLSLSSSYDLIPTLQITTGPQLELRLNDQPLNLTKSQKRLLLTVALSPHQKITTPSILEKIWPEEEGAENRLYTLTSRTRKAFIKAGVEFSDYLMITPGEITLENTHLDIGSFNQLLAVSENYAKSGFPALSRLVKFTALDSWSGLVDPALESLIDLDDSHRHAILSYQRTCVELARSPGLATLNETRLLQHLNVLFAAEPENLSIASAVCGLHNARGDGAGVYFTQQQFAKGLAALDLPDDSYQAQMVEFEQLSGLTTGLE